MPGPQFFLVAGFPKSGNNWMSGLMGSLDGVTMGARPVGAMERPGRTCARGFSPIVKWIEKNDAIMRLLKEKHVPFEDFLKKVIYAEADIPLPFTSMEQEELASHLAGCLQMGTLSAPSVITADDVAQTLFHPSIAPALPEEELLVLGCHGMHEPVDLLRELLPSFKIINIIRDPRDVLVSYFYHVMFTMRPGAVRQFTCRNELAGELEMRPRWQERFFRNRRNQLLRYYNNRHLDEGCFVVRFEDLKADTVGALAKIARFLGIQADPKALESAAEANALAHMKTRSTMVRKGVCGEWKRYFHKGLADILGDEFAELLIRLGYELDDRWRDELPDTPAAEFEFNQFRPKRSACQFFIPLYVSSPELRERYPTPLRFDGEDSFYAWLRQSDLPEVRDWLKVLDQLTALWDPIPEPQNRR